MNFLRVKSPLIGFLATGKLANLKTSAVVLRNTICDLNTYSFASAPPTKCISPFHKTTDLGKAGKNYNLSNSWI